MELERFSKFTLLIDGIYKNIHKIKLDTAPYIGIKSVHIFWIYSLRNHLDGLTATELAALSEIDRSLVSREVAKLCADGYIMNVGGTGKRKNYNSRLVLTEKGLELAQQVRKRATLAVKLAGKDLTDDARQIFYKSMDLIANNLRELCKDGLPPTEHAKGDSSK